MRINEIRNTIKAIKQARKPLKRTDWTSYAEISQKLDGMLGDIDGMQSTIGNYAKQNNVKIQVFSNTHGSDIKVRTLSNHIEGAMIEENITPSGIEKRDLIRKLYKAVETVTTEANNPHRSPFQLPRRHSGDYTFG